MLRDRTNRDPRAGAFAICGRGMFVLLALTLTVGCQNTEIRVARSAMNTELAREVISHFGPADVKTSWVDGRQELRVTLKGERYGALAISEKQEKAREVADYVRTRADRAEYASITVGFVDSADEAGTDEGLVQTSRTTVFTFPGT